MMSPTVSGMLIDPGPDRGASGYSMLRYSSLITKDMEAAMIFWQTGLR